MCIRDSANGGAGVAQIRHVRHAQLTQSGAYRRSGAMAAVEASSHHQTKVLVQSGIEFDQQHQCDQHAYGVLQYGNCLLYTSFSGLGSQYELVLHDEETAVGSVSTGDTSVAPPYQEAVLAD